MAKKTPPQELITEAATKAMSALVQLGDPMLGTPLSTELRTAIYHLTKAQLWIVCPDAMAEAEKGALGRISEKLAGRLDGTPLPANGARPIVPLK